MAEKISARKLAAIVLGKADLEKGKVGLLLKKLLSQTEERQRATDLVFGTVRNRFAIDRLIDRFAGCPRDRIQDKLLNIIRIGAYELFYNPLTPDYSIVSEAVETAKDLFGRRQGGFVNAVLRKLIRHIESRQVSLSGTNDRKMLPQTPASGCRFDEEFLPDAQKSAAEYLSYSFSIPQWMVERWLSRFGFEQTRNICLASNRRPSIYIRPNRLKTTADKIAERLRQADIDFAIAAGGEMLKIKSPRAVQDLPGFDDGWFTVQDITAAQPVGLMQVRPRWTILDLCAAPGTKTAQLAELTEDKGRIIATDSDMDRLEKVRENIDRLGIRTVETVSYGKLDETAAKTGPFDAVLLDVPCSNTGVLARRIEVRYRIRPQTAEQLSKTQYRLLQTAAGLVKPGGKVCYSTCSIEAEENVELVKRFLRENGDFQLEQERLTLPSAAEFDCDGGYAAVLVRQ